jgi:2,5-diamino-6-(ribosylamino)-4(3H)-pyrimidinone 5'-phosphate reductase
MNRPFVHMNVAVTVDGKIDTFERQGAEISSVRDKERVDRLRAGSDAILIGGRTLHTEDPKLTIKSSSLRSERQALGLAPNPVKVGVASRLDLKPDSNFLTAGPARVMLFTTSQSRDSQLALLRSRGAEVFVLGGERVDLKRVLEILRENEIKNLMVEGGATLNFELINLGLVDELTLFIAPMIFGGETAPTLADGIGLVRSAAIHLKLIKSEEWEDGGILLHYLLSNQNKRW